MEGRCCTLHSDPASYLRSFLIQYSWLFRAPGGRVGVGHATDTCLLCAGHWVTPKLPMQLFLVNTRGKMQSGTGGSLSFPWADFFIFSAQLHHGVGLVWCSICFSPFCRVHLFLDYFCNITDLLIFSYSKKKNQLGFCEPAFYASVPYNKS